MCIVILVIHNIMQNMFPKSKNIAIILKSVKHKILLRSHTHLEADHVYRLIERVLIKQLNMKIVTAWDCK